MTDIQIQECDLIEVIESITNGKVGVNDQDACEYLAAEIVSGLESCNSERTRANSLLRLNSALHHEVRASNRSKKITLSANGEASSSDDNNIDIRSSSWTEKLTALYDIMLLQIPHDKKRFLADGNVFISFGGVFVYIKSEK